LARNRSRAILLGHGLDPKRRHKMRPNLAERAGRWSAAHWKTATFGWLAFVAIAVVLGNVLGTVKLTDSESATGETARAEQILGKAGFHDHAGESVLIQSRAHQVSEPAFRRTVNRVVAKLETLPTVRDVRSPLAQGREGQLSADRHSALVQFSISGSSDTADSRVQPVLNVVKVLQRTSPAFTVAEFGDASAQHELNKTINGDLSHAEQLSVPITFLVLLFAFGAFVAAGVPVLLAFSGVLGSLGIAAAASHLFHASDATNSVMLLMGMAVGVDYSLFYLKREREERRNSAARPPRRAGPC
jgi:RND superfamily putative drug exporter